MIDNSDFAAIELLSSIEISVAELLTFYLVNFSYLSGELFLTCAPIRWFQWWVTEAMCLYFLKRFQRFTSECHLIWRPVPAYMTAGASLYDGFWFQSRLCWLSLPIWWTFPTYLVNSSYPSGEVSSQLNDLKKPATTIEEKDLEFCSYDGGGTSSLPCRGSRGLSFNFAMGKDNLQRVGY